MIVVDTGPVVALVDDHDDHDDHHHERCRDFLETHPGPLPLRARSSPRCAWNPNGGAARRRTRLPRRRPGGRYRLVDDLGADLDRIAELVGRYADLPLGTVDASVVALTGRLGLREVAPLDHRDFSIVRPRRRTARTLLP